MTLKAVKFHPGPEAAAKEAESPLVVRVLVSLGNGADRLVNIRNRGRNRRKKEKWS